MLSNAFNLIFQLSAFDCVYERPGEDECFTIKIAVSNYGRNQDAMEEVVLKGREFVVPLFELNKTLFNPIKRGDKLVTDNYGENTVQWVGEMRGLKGELLGFRVRTT
jgi:hypothetical protein